MQGPLSLKNKMLSSPLINISKASTPIRMRVISSNTPMNSTPISQLKYTSQSPSQVFASNKQNKNTRNLQESNLLQSKKPSQSHIGNFDIISNNSNRFQTAKHQLRNFSKTVGVIDNNIGRYDNNAKNTPIMQGMVNNITPSSMKAGNIADNFRESRTANLSPIMALNRKISQGRFTPFARAKPFRQLTPNNLMMKRQQSSFQTSQDNIAQQKFNKSMTLLQQKEKPQLNTSNSGINLRSSSSFSSLFQKRSKTPTRLGSMAFSSLSQNKNTPTTSNPPITFQKNLNLKQSNAFNKNSILGQSKGNLNLGMTSQNRRSQSNSYSSQGGGNYNGTQKEGDYNNSQSMYSNSNFNAITQNRSMIAKDKTYDAAGSMMCNNNHNKMAKYRVITSDNDQGSQSLIYCSKCAIQLVQKGFPIQELPQINQISSLHSSPRQHNFSELHQSKSNFQSKFTNFKTTYNSEILQTLQTAQRVKYVLVQETTIMDTRKSLLIKKYSTQIEQIDCYYNSLISYIEQQRAKDKQALEGLKNEIMQEITLQNKFPQLQQTYENRIHANLNKVQHFLKTRNTNSIVLRQLEEIQAELNQNRQQDSVSHQIVEIIENERTKIFYFDTSIQDQFDEFVAYLDQSGKLKYRPFNQDLNSSHSLQQSINFQHNQANSMLSKNNALRFSFQKALQNQNQKKIFMQTQMNPLQEEQEESYEENSFNKDNNMIESDQSQKQQQNQRPFRTLFAEQEDILQGQDVEDRGKNSMYSPTFKSI